MSGELDDAIPLCRVCRPVLLYARVGLHAWQHKRSLLMAAIDVAFSIMAKILICRAWQALACRSAHIGV